MTPAGRERLAFGVMCFMQGATWMSLLIYFLFSVCTIP